MNLYLEILRGGTLPFNSFLGNYVPELELIKDHEIDQRVSEVTADIWERPLTS